MFEKKDNQLNRYTDPTGELPNQELKLADWYVRHKLLLRKIFINFLLAWSVVTLTYSLGYIVYYVIFGYSQDQLLYQGLATGTNFTALQPAYQPQELQVKEVEVFPSAQNKYDFVALAYNPNERWLANLTYQFKYNGGETETQSTLLLPGDKRPIIFFGHKVDNYPGGVQIVFTKISWQRISQHQITDVPAFKAEHEQFEFTNFKFTSAGSANSLASAVQFTLANNSAYSFWQPEFYVELRNDNGAQGYLYFIEDKFIHGEKRQVDLRSMIDNLEVNDIIVYPLVNVFDPVVYMKVGE